MAQIDIVTPEPLAHPSRLLAIAHLFGIDVPTERKINILEIDCGDGGNLISIAASSPDFRCLGIGQSNEAIEHGSNLIEKANLENVRLICGTSDDIPVSDKFDVILVKNLYSRVPAAEKASLLKEISVHLCENGLILVEHLCLPGWSFKDSIRKQVQYHLRDETDPELLVVKGRQFIHALANSVPDHLTLYQAIAKSERDISEQIPDLNFPLEYLEENITPSFFHEFASVLESTSLQYLAEAALETMMINRFPDQIANILPETASMTDTEQYIDFATNRSRRFSILCPSTQSVVRTIEPDRVKDLWFSMASSPVDSAAILASPEATLLGPTGSSVTIKSQAGKAALLILTEHSPNRLSYPDIIEKIESKTGALSAEDISSVAEALSACAVSGIIQINLSNTRYEVSSPEEKPTATDVAKAQASERMPYVSSFFHNPVSIDAISGELLQMLDGSQTRDEIIEALIKKISEGDISAATMDGEKLESEDQIRTAITRYVTQLIAQFSSSGLLTG